MNKIDKIIINTLGILLLLAWTNYFIDSFVEALFVAFLLYILFKTVIVHSTNRFKNKRPFLLWKCPSVLQLWAEKRPLNILPRRSYRIQSAIR